jgi:hypothetical protein
MLDGVEWPLKRWQAIGPERSGAFISILGLGLVVLSMWNARTDLCLAITGGTTSFIQEEKIYPRDPERATREAHRILSQVEDNAILFANWDRLYSYVYTAHILEGRTDISLHELLAPPLPGTTTMAYIDSNIETRPIYSTVWLPEMNQYYQVEQIGDELWRITRK